MILYWDQTNFPDGPADLFYARVRCLWETYGPGLIAEFWVQRTPQREVTAWLCRSENCLSVAATAAADWEELADFAAFSGASMVFAPPQLAPLGASEAEGGNILAWSGENVVGVARPAATVSVLTNPPGERLYALLAQCQSSSLQVPGRDGFLSDYARRTRLGTGRAKLLRLGGVDAAAVMTTAEAPDLAVVGGVAVVPRARGRGMATAALGMLVEELCRESRSILLAASTDELACFYESRGLVRCGEWRLWRLR